MVKSTASTLHVSGINPGRLRLKTEIREQDNQLNNQPSIDLRMVCRSLLKIVARFEENQYTEGTLRQTAEQELDDLADPASAANTSQG